MSSACDPSWFRVRVRVRVRIRVNPNPNPNPNRSKGCQYFDEAADNLTGVLVNLDGLVYASSSSQA